MEWCDEARAVMIPFGGGSSVVEGTVVPDDRPAVPSTCAGSVRCSKWMRSVAAARIQAGALGPDDRGRASAPRPDPPALPAVVPMVDPRRMDRHSLRRALRDEPHPHRRLRRVDAHAHAGRVVGVPPAAGQRCRSQSRPHGHRQRGHARGDHRGLDAGPGAAGVPGQRWSDVPDLGLRVGGRSGHRPDEDVAGQSAHPRPVASPGRRRSRRQPDLLIIGYESAELPQDALIRVAVDIARSHGGLIDDEAIKVSGGAEQPTGRGAR